MTDERLLIDPKELFEHGTSFNGVSFESQGIVVERVHDPIPEMREVMVEKIGRHGSYVDELTYGPRTITLECRYLGTKWQHFDDLIADMEKWLYSTKDVPLFLRNHPTQYYNAHFKSYEEGDRIGGTGIGGFTLTFVASDPMRRPIGTRVVVCSGQRERFEVGGFGLADVQIDIPNAMPGSGTGNWGFEIEFANGTLTFPMSVPCGLRINCTNHTVTVHGEGHIGVTIDSVWPTFTPGWNYIEITRGTGTATLTMHERYL